MRDECLLGKLESDLHFLHVFASFAFDATQVLSICVRSFFSNQIELMIFDTTCVGLLSMPQAVRQGILCR